MSKLNSRTPRQVGTIILPILQMRKLGLKVHGWSTAGCPSLFPFTPNGLSFHQRLVNWDGRRQARDKHPLTSPRPRFLSGSLGRARPTCRVPVPNYFVVRSTLEAVGHFFQEGRQEGAWGPDVDFPPPRPKEHLSRVGPRPFTGASGCREAEFFILSPLPGTGGPGDVGGWDGPGDWSSQTPDTQPKRRPSEVHARPTEARVVGTACKQRRRAHVGPVSFSVSRG